MLWTPQRSKIFFLHLFIYIVDWYDTFFDPWPKEVLLSIHIVNIVRYDNHVLFFLLFLSTLIVNTSLRLLLSFISSFLIYVFSFAYLFIYFCWFIGNVGLFLYHFIILLYRYFVMVCYFILFYDIFTIFLFYHFIILLLDNFIILLYSLLLMLHSFINNKYYIRYKCYF